jgi:hypothetical protein
MVLSKKNDHNKTTRKFWIFAKILLFDEKITVEPSGINKEN